MSASLRMERDANWCSSCGVRLIGARTTVFNCPSCGAGSIGRCDQCRDQSVKYTCKSCAFSGP